VLSKPIDFLELSVRSRKAMERLQVESVGELVQLSEASMMAQKNFGQTSLNEVKSKLAQYGLKLKDS
jgi:DNA-directed RNA polymerase subunit alpha